MSTNMLSKFLIVLALIYSNEAKHQFDHYMPSDSGHVPLSYQQAEKGILHKNEDNPIISEEHEMSEEDLIRQEQSDADKLLKAALELKAANYGDGEEVTQTEKELLDRAAVEVVRLSSRLPQSTEERNSVVENLMRLVAADDAVRVSSSSTGNRRKKRSIKNYPSYKWKYGVIPSVFSSSLSQ